MRALFAVSMGLLAHATLPAQLTPSITVATASVQPGIGPPQTVVPGTDVTAGLSLHASGGNGSASATVVPGPVSGQGYAVQFSVSAGAQFASASAVLNTQMVVRSGGARAGVLNITASGSASPLGGTFGMNLVVGGVPVVNGPGQTVNYPIAFGATPVLITVSLGASVFQYGGGSASILVQVVPSAAAITEVTPSCGSIAMSVADRLVAFDVGIQGLQPAGSSIAVLFAGTQLTTISLSQPNCVLGTDPLAAWWLLQTPAGDIAASMQVPAAVRPLTMFVQAVEWVPLAGTTQSGPLLRIACP